MKKKLGVSLLLIGLFILFFVLLTLYNNQKKHQHVTNKVFTLNEVKTAIPSHFKEDRSYRVKQKGDYRYRSYQSADKSVRIVYAVTSDKHEAYKLYAHWNNPDALWNRASFYNEFYGNAYIEVISNHYFMNKFYMETILHQLRSIEKRE